MKSARFGFVMAAAILCLLITGCFTVNKDLEALLGQPKVELIAAFGNPNEITGDGQGGEIWHYYLDRTTTQPAHSRTSVKGVGNTYGTVNPYGQSYSGRTTLSGTATTTYHPAQTSGYVARRTFFINSDGTIYRFAWKGL